MLGCTECFLHGAPLPLPPYHDPTDDQDFDETDSVILLVYLLPGNSLVENLAVNKKNIQTVLNNAHVTVKDMSEMHLVVRYQRTELITATHVFIVVLSAIWETFCSDFYSTLTPEDFCCVSLVT